MWYTVASAKMRITSNQKFALDSRWLLSALCIVLRCFFRRRFFVCVVVFVEAINQGICPGRIRFVP